MTFTRTMWKSANSQHHRADHLLSSAARWRSYHIIGFSWCALTQRRLRAGLFVLALAHKIPSSSSTSSLLATRAKSIYQRHCWKTVCRWRSTLSSRAMKCPSSPTSCSSWHLLSIWACSICHGLSHSLRCSCPMLFGTNRNSTTGPVLAFLGLYFCRILLLTLSPSKRHLILILRFQLFVMTPTSTRYFDNMIQAGRQATSRTHHSISSGLAAQCLLELSSSRPGSIVFCFTASYFWLLGVMMRYFAEYYPGESASSTLLLRSLGIWCSWSATISLFWRPLKMHASPGYLVGLRSHLIYFLSCCPEPSPSNSSSFFSFHSFPFGFQSVHSFFQYEALHSPALILSYSSASLGHSAITSSHAQPAYSSSSQPQPPWTSAQPTALALGRSHWPTQLSSSASASYFRSSQ